VVDLNCGRYDDAAVFARSRALLSEAERVAACRMQVARTGWLHLPYALEDGLHATLVTATPEQSFGGLMVS
jgi:hypothetical protein